MICYICIGDKRETAKNIGLACNLIDPGMELIDMPHKKDAKQLNRLIHVTGHWAQPVPETELRDLFRSLVGGSIVEAALTGTESKTQASIVRTHYIISYYTRPYHIYDQRV